MGIYCADEYIPYVTINGLFEKGIHNVFYCLGSIFSVYIFEHINKICAVDPQTKSPAFRKIKFTAAFRFALTISHTFHLIYSSAFQQLQGLTGTVSSSAGTEDIGYIAGFILRPSLAEIYVHLQLPQYSGVVVCVELKERFVFTCNFFFPSEVSYLQFTELPVNHAISERFYCHRRSPEIFRLVSRPLCDQVKSNPQHKPGLPVVEVPFLLPVRI